MNGIWHISPQASTRYQITATDTSGCTLQKTFMVNVADCNFDVWLPNAFSPNGDGLNDNFGANTARQTHQYALKIWNRWGQLVFYSKSLSQKWNGKYKGQLQPQGSYVWQCKYSFGDSRRQGILTGTVSLLK